MKYISTISKTQKTNTIRIFLDLKAGIFILKVKENNFTATYDAKNNRFIDVNFIDLTWVEHTLIHTYFFINKPELLRILEETNESSRDFIEHNLKMPDIDYNGENYVSELTKLITEKERACN